MSTLPKPLLLTIWDCRDGYDDDAATARALARAAGWETASVLLGAPSRVVGTTPAGERWVRIPVPAAPMATDDVQRRALADRILSLDLERQAVEAAGAARHDRHRLRLVAEGKGLRQLRDRMGEEPLPHGELLDQLAAQEALVERLSEEIVRLRPTVVVALGVAGVLAALHERRPVVHVPATRRDSAEEHREPRLRPTAKLPRGANDAAWSAVLRALGCEAPAARPDPLAGLDTPRPGAGGVRLGVGPANFAGQGAAWGAAVRRELGASVEVLAVQREGFDYPADITPTQAEWESLEWQLGHVPRALSWTHALSESLRPVLGLLNGSVVNGDLPALRRADVSVAILCHGSETRSPALHSRLYEHAPFGAQWKDDAALQETADRNGRLLGAVNGLVFVSTPDLLDSVPTGTWLPVVVDEADFAPAPPVLEREVPVVVHAPTNPRFKGTEAIEPVLQALAAEGLIEYRRYGSLKPSEVPAALRDADVLVDHVVIGNYTVLGTQAMAAGRLVLGHVHDRVRRRLPRPLPVLEAVPGTVEQVLRTALADRMASKELAAQGPAYARAVHDGRLSARVLGEWLVS